MQTIKTLTLASVVGAVASLSTVSTAQAASISLSGSDATGYMALSGLNNEFGTEASYPGTAKEYEYPYYWNQSKGYWEVIVAEGLSASSSYAQEGSYNVLGKTISDANFGQFSLGAINYDDSLLTGSGVETIGVSQFTIDIDTTEFDPITSSRNVNNEFSWSYAITTSNLTGNGLTFVDGELTSIDVLADLMVDVILPSPLGGNLSVNWTTANGSLNQTAALSISGNQLAFDFDQTADAAFTLVGPLIDARTTITRAGTIDAVVSEVPVPAAAWLFISSLAGLITVGRRRKLHR